MYQEFLFSEIRQTFDLFPQTPRCDTSLTNEGVFFGAIFPEMDENLSFPLRFVFWQQQKTAGIIRPPQCAKSHDAEARSS